MKEKCIKKWNLKGHIPKYILAIKNAMQFDSRNQKIIHPDFCCLAYFSTLKVSIYVRKNRNESLMLQSQGMLLSKNASSII